MQYLIFSGENDKVGRFFEGIFPRLREDEALLEAAFTLEEYRGLGLMPFVMNQLAEKARQEGSPLAPHVRLHRECWRAQGMQACGVCALPARQPAIPAVPAAHRLHTAS